MSQVSRVVHGRDGGARWTRTGYRRDVAKPKRPSEPGRASSIGEREQDRYRLLVEDLVATEENTYADVARRLGIRKDHLTRVMRGERRVSLEARRRAAQALGFSERYFTDDTTHSWRHYRGVGDADLLAHHADPEMLLEQCREVYAVLGEGRRPVEEGYRLALLVTTIPAFHHARRVIEAREHYSRRGEEPGPAFDLAVQHLAVAVRELFAAPQAPTRR